MRRARRWAVRGLLALAVAGALGLLGLELLSRTARARDLLRMRTIALLASATGTRVTIGAIEASPLGRSLLVHDLALTLDHKPLLGVSRVEITYSPLALLHRRLLLTRVALTGLRLRAVRDASGWRLPPRSQGGGGGGMPVEIGELRIEGGRVAVALLDATPPRRIGATAIDLTASGGVDADRQRLTVTSLRFVPRGIALSPVTAAGSVAAGPDGVSVPSAWLATVATRVEATTRVDRGGRVSARLGLAPLGARDLRALVPSVRLQADATATLTAEGPRDAVALRADLDAGPGGRLTVAGTVDAQSVPPRYTAAAHFTDVDPGGAIEGLVRARANGRLRVRGRGTDRRATFAYGLGLERSEVAGRAIDRLVLAGRGRRGVHHARSRLSAAGGNRVTVQAAAALGSVPLYRARAWLHLPRLETIVPGSPGWAYARVGVRGRGTAPRERQAEMVATLAGAEVRGIPLHRGLVRAEVSGTRVRLTEALVEGPELKAASSATLDVESRAVDASLEATADLSGLGARVGAPLGGAAMLRAHAAGPLQSLVAEVMMTVKEPRYRTMSGEEMAAKLDWRRGGDTDRARLAVDLRGHEDRGGRVALAIVRTPARTTGEVGELTVAPGDGAAWHLAHPAPFAFGTRLEITDLTLVAGAERVTLTARAGPSGPADGVLDCEHVRLDRLCSLAGAPRCAGELTGRVRLAGAAEAPCLEAEVVAAGLAVEDAQYGDLQAHATYAPRALALHAGLRYPRAGELSLDGTVPFDLAWAGPRQDTSAESLRLEVGADRLDLAFLHALAPGQVRESHGHLSAKLRLQGPRAAPRADGFVTVDDGRFELAATGVAYENVRLRLRGANTALELEELRAEAGGGTVEGAGRVTLSGLQPTTLDLKLKLNDFLAIRQSAYEAVLAGPLKLGGTVSDPVLTGDLEVSRAVVRPASLPVSKPALHPDPTIEVAGTSEAGVTPPAPTSALAEALALGLRVRIARNAWIRRVDANIELGGDLKVEKRPHCPVGLDGSIRLLRGWYTFQGRRFTVEDGAILFHGEAPPQPTFDVTASYRASQYRVEVHVSGSAEKPTLMLTSDPPLEQADILAVILFGKPTHELGRGESTTLQQQAVQIGAGYVTPELQASVMSALGLDTLDVALPQGSAPGAVRAGRYVAQDVFVSLGQEFGKNAAQIVGVEYGLTRNVSVKASTSSRGASAIDLFWHRRY